MDHSIRMEEDGLRENPFGFSLLGYWRQWREIMRASTREEEVKRKRNDPFQGIIRC